MGRKEGMRKGEEGSSLRTRMATPPPMREAWSLEEGPDREMERSDL